MSRYDEYQATVDSVLLKNTVKSFTGNVLITPPENNTVNLIMVKYSSTFGIAPMQYTISAEASYAGLYALDGKLCILSSLEPAAVTGSGVSSFSSIYNSDAGMYYNTIVLTDLSKNINITY